LEPRHPPNALTSLTTKNVAISTAPARNPGRAWFPNQCSFESLRQMAKSSRLQTQSPSIRVVSAHRSIPSKRLSLTSSSLCSCTEGTFASSTINQLSDLELADASRRVSELVRASHFVQLFDCQDRQNSAGRVGQERFELSTPRLSSVCSNQLSYWPVG
jgi:hypothetical protein